MAREKIYRFKRNNPDRPMPDDAYIDDGMVMLPRLLRPKELAKYGLIDLNEGFTKLTIYRSSINMRQATLSKITGIPVRTIQGWEMRGLNEAKAIMAVKVAKALKCTVEDLMEED